MSSYEPYVPGEPAPEARGETEAVGSRPPTRGGWCGRQGGGEVERFVVASGTCVAIWLMAGAGYFWPMWVMLGTGVPVLVHRAAGVCRPRAGDARPAYPGEVDAAASVSGRLRRRDRQY